MGVLLGHHMLLLASDDSLIGRLSDGWCNSCWAFTLKDIGWFVILDVF
jgi:hypothetical protein